MGMKSGYGGQPNTVDYEQTVERLTGMNGVRSESPNRAEERTAHFVSGVATSSACKISTVREIEELLRTSAQAQAMGVPLNGGFGNAYGELDMSLENENSSVTYAGERPAYIQRKEPSQTGYTQLKAQGT